MSSIYRTILYTFCKTCDKKHCVVNSKARRGGGGSAMQPRYATACSMLVRAQAVFMHTTNKQTRRTYNNVESDYSIHYTQHVTQLNCQFRMSFAQFVLAHIFYITKLIHINMRALIVSYFRKPCCSLYVYYIYKRVRIHLSYTYIYI